MPFSDILLPCLVDGAHPEYLWRLRLATTNKRIEVRSGKAAYRQKAMLGESVTSVRRNQMVSVITPMYGEEDNIDPLFRALLPVLKELGRDFEIIAVNDGS